MPVPRRLLSQLWLFIPFLSMGSARSANSYAAGAAEGRAEVREIMGCSNSSGAISPCGGTATVPVNTTGTLFIFTITNNSSSYLEGGITCAKTGTVSACTVLNTIYELNAHTSMTDTLSYNTGSLAGAGSVTITTGGTIGVLTATVTVTVPPPYAVAVTPKGQPTTAIGMSTNSQNFTIQNTGTSNASFDMSATPCNGAVTYCQVTSSHPITIVAGGNATATMSYIAGPMGSTGTARLRAWYASNSAINDTGSVNETVGFKVTVTPDNSNVTAPPATATTQQFTITNNRPVSTQYNLTTICTATATNCGSLSPVIIGSQGAATVNVTYTSGANHTSGIVKLIAKEPGDSLDADSGWVNVSAVNVAQSAPALDIASVNPGAVVDRNLCLTIAAGAGAAWECGDLRIAHSLPKVRTLNKVRTPSLLYASQTAHPYPVVSGNATLADSTIVPDTIVMALSLSGTVYYGRWIGSDFQRGATRRIAVGFDAIAMATGAYSYTVTLTNVYNSTHTQLASPPTNGTLLLVNRSASAFGAGWWIAGLEQIFFPSADTTSRLWTGGDGSARVYSKVATSVWAAPKVDRPDTLKWNGTNYVLYVTHGTRIYFNSAGQHISTVNRLGHTTTFAYGSGRLTSIQVPTPPGGYSVSYGFNYDGSGRLTTIASPGPTITTRTTTVTTTSGRIATIQDPNGSTVSFGYAVDSNRITSRTNRLGVTTSYGFDAGRHFSQDSLLLASGAQKQIVVRYRSADSLALAGRAIAPESAYVRLDGPRPDADAKDYTFLWLDRFGEVAKVADALGRTSTITRADPNWPALVTQFVQPHGRVTHATYDAHGNILTTTDSSTFRDSAGVRKYATTQYAWDSVWDYEVQVTTPQGRISRAGYDSLGRRIFQQAGADSARRVTFAYYGSSAPGSNLVRSLKTPLSVGRDSLTYDANLGNLLSSISPMGFRERHLTDRAGRDTLVSEPIDSAQHDSSFVRSAYDIADHDTLVVAVGPSQWTGLSTAQALSATVRKFYNAAGFLDSLFRSSTPDSNNIGVLKTSWLRDRADRVVRETPPGVPIAGALRSDSSVYDLAGNKVQAISRRGDIVTMSYDPLNRIARRVIPGFTTTLADTGYLHGILVQFPRYGIESYPPDTETYGYDLAGNMDSAFNTAARVVLVFNPNGTLAADTSRDRTVHGPSFNYSTHVYGLRLGYDLDGRRLWLKHPAILAPRYPHSSVANDSVAYAYDSVTGNVARVRDVLGNLFVFTYDLEGRLDSTTLAGGTGEKRHYDEDGRLLSRLERLPGFASGFHHDTLHAETMRYDARGKIVRAITAGDSTQLAYDGLGHVVLARTWDSNVDAPYSAYEEWRLDALGHPQWSIPFWSKTIPVPHQRVDHFYRAGTEQDTSIHDVVFPTGNVSWDVDRYDASGNRYYHSHRGLEGDVAELTWSYYRGDNRLIVADRQVCYYPGNLLNCEGTATPSNLAGAYEEYGYDALGRRVTTITRRESSCSDSTCVSAIAHTVWDGSQILYEIRTPAVDSLERDTVPVNARTAPFGWLAYTHGLGLDQPLNVIRMGFGVGYDTVPDLFKLLVIVPHLNWRGYYDGGTVGISPDVCAPTAGGGQVCLAIAWPAANATTYGSFTQPVLLNWFGSLIVEQRDGSGMLYRRNRYYDAYQGRFTQEDPIGLGGGLNAYGFAGGDPVNYTDPFGLCPYIQHDYNVLNCPNDKVGKAFRLLAKSAAPAADSTIHVVADKRVTISQSAGMVAMNCAPEAGCSATDGGVIYLDGTASPGSIAALVAHEATHHELDPRDVLREDQEVVAWNRALDVYESLPASEKKDPVYNEASAMRKAMGQAGWDAFVRTKECKKIGKEC